MPVFLAGLRTREQSKGVCCSRAFVKESHATGEIDCFVGYPRGGGSTAIYGLYRYVPRNRVWFLRVSVLK